MIYEVKQTSRFKRHIKSLDTRLGLTKEEAREAVSNILDSIEILREKGTLPDEYGFKLHELVREPWAGFMEYHALDDVLIVYYTVTSKNVIRLTGIYNHDLLNRGVLD